MVHVMQGAVIRKWRLVRDMTQQSLAVALGMSAAAVTQWERDVIVPKRPTAERLDELLDAHGEILAACGYTAADPTETKPAAPARAIPPSDAAALRQLIAEQALQLELLTSRVSDLDAELRLLRLAVGRAARDSA